MRIIIVAALMAGATWIVAAAQAQDTEAPLDVAPAQSTAPAQEAPPSTAGLRIITRSPPAVSEPETPSSPATSAVREQEASPPPVTPAARYHFDRVDNGFLRLDNETGEIAYCSRQAAGWSCRAVAEHRVALETEIAQLRNEAGNMEQLRSDVEGLKQFRNEGGDLKQLRTDVEGLKQLRSEVEGLTQLRGEVGDLKQLRSDVEGLKQLRDEVGDLRQLRSEVEGLKQLRDEVGDLKELRSEVEDLKKQVTALRAPPPPVAKAAPKESPPRPPGTVPPAGGSDNARSLPSRENIDRAAAFISDAWRRLVEMIVNLQKDAMRRS